ILADAGRYAKMAALVGADKPADATLTEINQYMHDTVAEKRTGSDQALNLFKDLSLYDRNGTVVAASDDILIGRVVNRQAYFEASLKGAALQAPFYALGTGELTMVLTYPIQDASKQTIGVLAGRLNLNTLGQIMTERAGLGNTGETYLVSAQ